MAHCARRDQARVLGQALLDARWIEALMEATPGVDPIFKDDLALYRPSEVLDRLFILIYVFI